MRIGWIGLICIMFSGCYERQEGCLDVLANNFDLDADRDCCCTYPNLIFDVKHLMDTVNLELNAIYYNDLGQSFLIGELNYFISDIWLTKDGVVYTLDDSVLVELTDAPGEIAVVDVIRLNKNQFQYTVGTFKEPGTFDELNFSVGLKEPFHDAISAQFESDSPLAAQGNPLLDDQLGYLNFKIEMARDTTDLNLVQLQSNMSSDLVEIGLDLHIDKLKGRNLVVRLEIDYYQWFRSLDLEGDSLEAMREKILSGMLHSFSVSN